MGSNSKANGSYAINIGVKSEVNGRASQGFGDSIYVNTNQSLALGTGAQTLKDENVPATTEQYSLIAVGSDAKAIGSGSIAFGAYSTVQGFGNKNILKLDEKEKRMQGGIEVTHSTGVHKTLTKDVSGNVTVTVTSDNLEPNDEESVAKREGETYGAMALGYAASSHALAATAIGHYATAVGRVSIAAGTSSKALGYHAIAYGGFSKVSGENAGAFGYSAEASGDQSLSLGYNSDATAKNSVALGAESVANEENTVSVGSDTLKRKITNVADGTQENDAVNVRQLNTLKAETQKITPRIEKIEQRNDVMTQEYRTGIEQLAKRSDTIVKEHRSRIEHIEKRNQQMTKEYRSGIASAIAIGGLQSASIPGKQGVSVGVGNFKGANSLAVGYSRLSSDGSVSLKINAALSSSGYSGGGASVGFMW
uniref:Adhesin YadA n=1 Tax=Haemophilus influenzae TaxID=727 RepID=A0AB37B660_HAEIF|nr:YadA-like family protein [Haemophilus influenzae]PRJ24225.1 Adhesin YadA precursor [Haemophilus influenzae]PRM81962.1 Adhesin YadA precursor [Haemophilus influenzae]